MLAVYLNLRQSKYINVRLTPQHFMYFHFETFAQKIWDICNVFNKNLLFFNSLFLFLSIWEIDVFLHVLIFAIRAFWLISDVLTFKKFVEYQKRTTVMGGTYFIIFQSKGMLSLCLNLNESQPIFAYKCYPYRKECTWVPRKRKPFW